MHISTTNKQKKGSNIMQKRNIEIFKSLRAHVTPMDKFDLVGWLEAMLSVTDISATVKSCIDNRGFIAHNVTLSDNHGSNRSFVAPSLSNTFTFDEYNIGTTYSIKSPKTQVDSKNMYVIPHTNGLILVSYNSMICFYDLAQNTVYFKRNAFMHSVTTSHHINTFLTSFVPSDALKMYANQIR